MIDNSYIKNLLISSDTIPSQNLVVAEWNMNRYQTIANYGLYTGRYNNPDTDFLTSYDQNSPYIKSGKLYLVYDDNSYKVDEDDQYYSNIASIFESDRPDPGIVLLTNVDDGVISLKSSNLKVDKINSASPRFYPFSKSRTYDYFNSARYADPEDKTKVGITAAGAGGAIQNANIFVVYENSFPCNKIVIKMQDYKSVPNLYAIDILNTDDEWDEVFFEDDANDIVNGVLEIYYKKINGNDSWTIVPARVDDLNELTTPSTQLKTIKGIRLRVGKMTVPSSDGTYYKSSLELIEMSPRIEADLTNYTENITINSSISDSQIGLPVGNLVSGNGSILLSNEDGFFLAASKAAEYKLMTSEVEFRIYQVMEANSQTYNIPLKVLYSDSWDTNDDFTTTVSLVDKMSLLSKKKSVDMSFVSKEGMPMSALILFLLDNCGVTGYEFKSQTTKDDILIKTFFCKKEETITEVLEKIAVATQSTMFFDAFNNLNVLTKEKIAQIVSNANANYWMVMDEDFGGYTGSTQFKDYLSNVISVDDEKIEPVTDGKIQYRAFGINKSAGYSLLQDIETKNYLDDNPFLLLAGAGYGPKFTRVWSADQTKDSVFGTATLTGSVSGSRVKNVFTGTYSASTQEGAVSKMFSTSNATQKKSLLIPLDKNDIYYFNSFSGYVMIDQEIIAYNGKVFSINGVQKILFSKEQLLQEVANLSRNNSSILPEALVIDVIFNPLNKNSTNDDEYDYTVKSDGRGQFGTEIAEHLKDPVGSYVKTSNIRSFVIGSAFKQAREQASFKIEKYYDFSSINNWSKLRTLLGFDSSFRPVNYNGLLKLTGPTIPIEDRKAATSGSAAIANQNKINKEVSENIGDFGPFVYTNGERNVYIQKINLDDEDIPNFTANFTPSIIASRFKLMSSKETQTLSGPEISAHSSIAGIGFALKEVAGEITNGYFFEVESFGSAGTKEEKVKDKNARASNIRFYRVSKKDGKLIPDILAVARANIIPSLDTTLQFNPEEPPPADQIVDLEVRISLNNNGKHKFALYYGNKKIKFTDDDNDSNYIDTDGNIIDYDNDLSDIWTNAKNIFMFLRNDSSVVFDYILAAKSPSPDADTYYSLNSNSADVVTEYRNTIRGALPNKGWFNDKNSNVKYFDFANTAREVKKYTARYNYPVLDFKLIDVSRVNPKYRVLRKSYTPMGAELVVVNTANEPISLSENSQLPLFIIGTQIEEITNGEISMKDIYDKTDEFGKKQVFLARNKSIYGENTFNFSSDFIQSIDQATGMMRWIINNCSRERFRMNMEIFFNPLLELGDKVKVFSSKRGYYEGYQGTANTSFGNKTFIISSINHSISSNGVSTNITIVEVGE